MHRTELWIQFARDFDPSTMDFGTPRALAEYLGEEEAESNNELIDQAIRAIARLRFQYANAMLAELDRIQG